MFKKNTSLLKLLRAGCLFACSMYSFTSVAEDLRVRVKVLDGSGTPRANAAYKHVSSAAESVPSPLGARQDNYTKNIYIQCDNFISLMQAIPKGVITAINQEGDSLATPSQIVKAINAKRERKGIESRLDIDNPEQSLENYTATICDSRQLNEVLSELGDIAPFARRIGFVIDMDAVIKPVLCAQKEFKELAASAAPGKIYTKSFSKFIGTNVLSPLIDKMVGDMPAGMTETFLRSLENSDGTTRSDLLGMLEDVAFTLSGTIDNEWRELLNTLYMFVRDKKSLVFKVSSSSKGQVFKDKHLSDVKSLLSRLLPELYKDKDDRPSISLLGNDSEYKVSTVSVENMEKTGLGMDDTVKKISDVNASPDIATYPGYKDVSSLRAQLLMWSAADTENNDYIELDDESKPLVIGDVTKFWEGLLRDRVIPEFWKMQNVGNNQRDDLVDVVDKAFERFVGMSQHLIKQAAIETSEHMLRGMFSDTRTVLLLGSPSLQMFADNSGAQNSHGSAGAVSSNTLNMPSNFNAEGV